MAPMARSKSLAKITDDEDRLLQIVFDVLATYRLTTLIKDDKITEDIRKLVFRRYGEPSDDNSHKVSYLLTCPWCLSIYFGGLAVVAGTKWPRMWKPFSKALSYSAMTGLLAEARANAQEPDEPPDEQVEEAPDASLRQLKPS
jgi:hypothetical protein